MPHNVLLSYIRRNAISLTKGTCTFAMGAWFGAQHPSIPYRVVPDFLHPEPRSSMYYHSNASTAQKTNVEKLTVEELNAGYIVSANQLYYTK